MHLRLSHKLILFALATAVFEGVLIGYFLYAGSRKAITDDVLRVNEFKAQETSDVVNDQFQRGTTHVRNFVRVLAHADEGGVRASAVATFDEVESLVRLELIAADGNSVLAVVREDGDGTLERPVDVKALHALLAGAEVPGHSVSCGKGKGPTPDRIIIGFPVEVKGKAVALCQAHLDAARMTADLYTAVEEEGRTIRVFDSLGQVVFAPPLRPQDLSVEGEGGPGAKAVSDLVFVREMLKWKGKRSPVRPSYEDERGRRIVVAWAPIEVGGLTWYAIVEQSAKEAYGELEQLKAPVPLRGPGRVRDDARGHGDRSARDEAARGTVVVGAADRAGPPARGGQCLRERRDRPVGRHLARDEGSAARDVRPARTPGRGADERTAGHDGLPQLGLGLVDGVRHHRHGHGMACPDL